MYLLYLLSTAQLSQISSLRIIVSILLGKVKYTIAQLTPLSSKIKDVLKTMSIIHPAHSELRNILDIVRKASCSHSMALQPSSQQNIDNRKRSFESSNATSTSLAIAPQTNPLPSAQPPQVLQKWTTNFKRPNLNVSVAKRSTSFQNSISNLQSSSATPQLSQSPPLHITGTNAKKVTNYTMVQIPYSPLFSQPSAKHNSKSSAINSHIGEAATKIPWQKSVTASSSSNADFCNELLQNIPYDKMINFLRSEFNRDEKLQKDLIKIVFEK